MAKTTMSAPMPPSRRAKQFVPFGALKGLKDAIAQKEHTPTPRRALSEDAIAEINTRLLDLKPGQLVTVVYYCDYTQEYHQLTGKVSKVDPYWKSVTIGNISIDFAELYQVEPFF